MADGGDATDTKQLASLFAAYAEREGLLGTITEQECARLAKAFFAGYADGLYGNAEHTGNVLTDHAARLLRLRITGSSNSGTPGPGGTG